jgi:hypothetical protein
MSSCQPKPWLTRPPESLPFSCLKPPALLEYNKPEPQIANYFTASLE